MITKNFMNNDEWIDENTCSIITATCMDKTRLIIDPYYFFKKYLINKMIEKKLEEC